MQKDPKLISPIRNKRLKAKNPESLAAALKQNLKRRKVAKSSSDSDDLISVSEKIDQS